MSRRRKRKKKGRSSFSQGVLLVLTGAALMLCGLSITYGVLIRQSVAENDAQEFRVEILNGTGERGLASRAAASVRRKGIDVFQVGNANHFHYRETVLIGRRKSGDLHALGRVLGCENVIEQFSGDSYVDATLILGADYQELKLNLDDGGDSPK